MEKGNFLQKLQWAIVFSTYLIQLWGNCKIVKYFREFNLFNWASISGDDIKDIKLMDVTGGLSENDGVCFVLECLCLV